jgi:protocatechuate 3,4-dioxygenase alpha subunit
MSTPAQTVGPFLHIALPWPDGPYAVAEGTPGAVRIAGHLTDGAGAAVPDGMVEIWQVQPGCFGRCATDGAGRFWFLTLKPSPLPAGNGETEAPHLDVSVFARGLLHRLVTRIYFPDEPAANAADPVLRMLDADERALLTARAEPDGSLRFDIRLQGENETPFFEL